MATEILKKFRDRGLATRILREIRELDPKRGVKFMHVCASHEVTITRFGLRTLFPEWLEVVSGPGCPVCVTGTAEIDEAIELAKMGHVITTFGDMFKVPGTRTSLSGAKTDGADVRIVYGMGGAVKVAERNPDREVVHIAIGFETTAPMTASEVLRKPPRELQPTHLPPAHPACHAVPAGIRGGRPR